MIIEEKVNALKGPKMSALGKALGLKANKVIVRTIMSIKEKPSFRTKQEITYFPKMMYRNSVRNMDFALIHICARTVFLLHPLPRASFRFVPPETLPWANLFWPFRPEKYYAIDL